jgi:hypothetical protein
MKPNVFFTFLLSLTILTSKSQDLPNPPANLQTLPAGSFVIAMDNSLQSDDQPVGFYGKFNLKTYGLLVHLLNNNVKLKWSIAAGKIKDGVDFIANTELTMPTYAAAAVRSFKSGPFVIFAADTAGVRSLVNSYYTSRGLTGLNRPNIYRTTSSTITDIRYNLTNFVPKAAILTDGGNERIHEDYFISSGITAQNYGFVEAVDLSSCFTFASEPHNSKSGAEVDSTVKNIRRFVLLGRNFLAQCAAVRTYENSVFGRFQTTNGFNDENVSIGTNVLYPYADLSFYQIEGTYNASSGGSLKNWKLAAGSQISSSFNKVVSSVDTSALAITMSKLVTGTGGLVYYMGNHDFNDNNESGTNGIRMYMNAFLTPAQPAFGCSLTLPVKLVNFQGNLFNNNVKLQWTVSENEGTDKFEVERSMDGNNFSTASLVLGTEKSGSENYQYAENVNTGKIFYRLKMTDKSGKITYSKILVFQTTSLTDAKILIINNPVSDKLTMSFESANNQVVDIRILDMSGRIVQSNRINSYKGNNLVSFSLPSTLNKGIYMVSLFDGAKQMTTKFVKQ